MHITFGEIASARVQRQAPGRRNEVFEGEKVVGLLRLEEAMLGHAHQHATGEVRIEGEELAIAKKLGFSDLKSFRASLATNTKLIPTSREQILETYRRYIAQMSPQLPKLFGFSIEGDGPLRELWAIAEAILSGKANWIAFAVGAGALAVILLLKNYLRVPGILIAVVGATAIVGSLNLATRADVSVLGPLPQGLPAFTIPWINQSDIVPVLIGGLAVALVSFADTSVLSRAYAARTKTNVDPNQEMVGLGAANLAAGFFQGFPISSSSSRTPVAEAAGARTQLTGVVGALSVALLLVAAPNLLKDLPTAALAAVVIASAIGLFEITDLVRIFHIQRWEFWLSIVCFLGVAVFGAIPGIGLAIAIAVMAFLWNGWRPYSAVLGRPNGVEGYHDITRYPDARQIPGLVLFRWDAPLFFANAELFRERVLNAVAKSSTPVRRVVVAAEPVTGIDITAADALAELDEALSSAGIELCFAELKDPVKDKLKRFGLFSMIGEKSFFPTIEAAVRSYVQDHAIDWAD